MNDWILIGCNIILVFIECTILLVLGTIFFKRKVSRAKMIISLVLLSFLYSFVISNTASFPIGKSGALIILGSIWLEVIFTSTMIKAISVSVGYVSFVYVFDNLAILLFSLLTEHSFYFYMSNPIGYYLISYIIKCLEISTISVFGVCIKRKMQFQNATTYDWVCSVLFPCVSLIYSIAFLYLYQKYPETGTMILICTIVLMMFNILAIAILAHLDHQQRAIQDNIILQRSIQQERESLETWQNAYSDQRKLTHDFRNQLGVLYGLAQQKAPYEEIMTYANRLLGETNPPVLRLTTGRSVLDILLNQKYSISLKKNIDLQMHLSDLSNFPLSDEKLVVILANLLDNAITACEKVSDVSNRKILIKIQVRTTASYLYQENGTSQEVKIINNQVVASKKSSPAHGYGLKNVMSILNQAHAIYFFDYSSTEQKFIFSAEFPNRQVASDN